MPTPKSAQPHAPLQNANRLRQLFAAPSSSPSFDIPQAPPAAAPASIQVVPIAEIVVGDRIRKYYDPHKISRTAKQIKEDGFLGTVWVRMVNGVPHLIAGGSRLQAAQLAGETEIAVSIVDADDRKALFYELFENFGRSDLTPIEEAEGVMRYLEEALSMDRAQIASALKRMSNYRTKSAKGNNDVPALSKEDEQLFARIEALFTDIAKYTPDSFRSHRLPLLNMPQALKAAVDQGLDYTKARVIASLKDEAEIESLLAEVMAENLTHAELSARVKQSKAKADPEPSPQRRLQQEVRSLAAKLGRANLRGRKLQQAEKLLGQLTKLLSESES